ncbi:ABC transporter ATP-binding protein, partial [Levilactobacillus brevis]|nr:ABC transporter ATP-binding protein [Levilactobacillus brevis]
TFVFVTHDMHEALRLGQHIAVMRLGHIQQVGTGEEIMHHPANEFVRGFFENEHTPRPATVQVLVNQGYGATTTTAATLPVTATVNELAAALKKGPVIVGTASGNRTLTTADLLDYLAQTEVE